jgi:hypothetical protein
MTEGQEDRVGRQTKLIAMLVAKGVTVSNPEAYIRSFTLKALRALAADTVSTPAEKGEARLQIYQIARLAMIEIRVARIKPLVETTGEDGSSASNAGATEV